MKINLQMNVFGSPDMHRNTSAKMQRKWNCTIRRRL